MARVTIVQYAGDYRETFERFEAGGQSTYQAQRYSVNFVAGLAARHEQVAVICSQTAEPYDEVLGNGVRAIGMGFQGPVEERRYVDCIASTKPTHLVATTPYRPMLAWAIANRVPTIAVLADSFDGRRLRDRYRNYLLKRQLNDPLIDWVGNHGLNACLSLLDIGVSPQKVVPWDWPPSFRPEEREPRTREPGPLRLTYVGGVLAAKGVGDLLDAIALLRQRGVGVTAVINGPDAGGAMAAHAASLSLGDAVTFAGPIPNEAVPAAMRDADAVVVPSRHEYPEGLPLTIYEALSARTPILASDHPMFKGALVHNESAIVFRASDPASMAAAIEELGNDSARYAALSEATAAAWQRLQLPVVWGELVGRWLDGGDEGRRWIGDHAIASGRYDERLAERRLARKG